MREQLVLHKRKNEWGEYKIKYYKDGKEIEDGSYYTDDWEDAIATFKAISKNLKLEWTIVHKINLITGKERFVHMITK